jgi:hypothetical protein
MRILLNLYERQRCRSKWRDCVSADFFVGNGIRQGSVSSPILFCLYLDVLIKKLEAKRVGCHIGHKYFGCVAYADDIVLLCPSVDGLRAMLSECENFCSTSKLQFNATKSVCMKFRRSRSESESVDVYLNGENIPWKDEVKHLGNIIAYNLSEEREIITKRGDLTGRVNMLSVNCHNLHSDVILKLFFSQCTHFYGAQAWVLNDKNIKLSEFQFY